MLLLTDRGVLFSANFNSFATNRCENELGFNLNEVEFLAEMRCYLLAHIGNVFFFFDR